MVRRQPAATPQRPACRERDDRARPRDAPMGVRRQQDWRGWFTAGKSL